MPRSICVFSSSSDEISDIFFKAAEELGKAIAEKNFTLVYGGGNNGLMGALALSVHKHKGKVIGVIPEYLKSKGYAYSPADELIVTKDLRERKTFMEDRSDAFLTLPGGFGTLEELAEVLALKQLKQHTKPIVILNINGFYDQLLLFFEEIYKGRFTSEKNRKLYHVATDIEGAFKYLEENLRDG